MLKIKFPKISGVFNENPFQIFSYNFIHEIFDIPYFKKYVDYPTSIFVYP